MSAEATTCSLRRLFCCGTADAPAHEVRCADSIHAMDASAWDALAGDSYFCGRQFLAAIESAPPDNMQFRYAIISRGGRPVAAVYCQLMRVNSRQLAASEENVPSAMRRIAIAARNTALATFGTRLLVCGNMFATGAYGIRLHDSRDDAAHVEVLQLLTRWQREEADYLLLKDHAGDDRHLDITHAARGLGKLLVEPSMTLRLRGEWHTYQDYLAALKAKYRKAALEIARRVDEAGLRLERLDDLREEQDQLYTHYRSVEARAEMRFGLLPPEHFTALQEYCGDNLRCVVLRGAEGIAAFGVLLREGRSAHAHIVGFDATLNVRVPLYLRMLQALVGEAIDWQCDRLCLGRTALEPKARLGAEPTPSAVYVRHRNPLLNALASPLLRAVPRATAPERTPFHG